MTEEVRSPGKTTIAPNVLLTIARLTTLNVEGVSGLSEVPGGFNRLFRRNLQKGVRVRVEDNLVDVDLHVVMEKNINVREVSRTIQRDVARAISEMVGMEVGHINIHIEDIEFQETAPEDE